MLTFDTHHTTQNRLRPITAIGHLSDTGDQFITIFLGNRLHNKNSYIWHILLKFEIWNKNIAVFTLFVALEVQVYVKLSFVQSTVESDFRNAYAARILQPDRQENADWAYVFGFLTCFCCNIPVGLLALLLANQVWIKIIILSQYIMCIFQHTMMML